MLLCIGICLGFRLAGPLMAAPSSPADKWKSAMESAQRATSEATRLSQLKEALAAAAQLGETDPRLLETLVRLASPCDAATCNEEERVRHMDRALRLREVSKPADRRLSELLMELGTVAAGDGRFREALQCYRDALQILEKTADKSPVELAQVHLAMAKAYQQQGEKVQARLTMDHALEITERAGEAAAEQHADLLEQSGNLYSDQDQTTNAKREYDRALEVRQRIWGKQDSRYIGSMRDIALLMTWQSPGYAESLLKRVIDAEREAEGERSEEHYMAIAALAGFYSQHKRFGEAGRLYQDALAVRSSFERAGDAEAARCLYSLALVRMQLDHYDGAVEAAERSLAIRHTLPADPRNETLGIQALLAEAYLVLNEPGEAEKHYRDFAQVARNKDSALLIQTAERLSQMQEGTGDYGRAAEKLETAIAALEAAKGAEDAELTDRLRRLAGLYERLGRPGDALGVNMRANQIAWKNLLQSMSAGGSGAVGLLLLGMVALAVILAGGAVAGYAWFERKLEARIRALFATQASPESQPVAVRRLQFHGQAAPLFTLRVRNLLLTLVTCGMYGFWAKAKVKGYLFGQAEFEADRLVFHGTGRELFQGWMKGLPAIALLLFIPNLLPAIWNSPYSRMIGQVALLVGLALLWPVARAGAHRYRMNRLSWRGVRFGFRGSTTDFQLMSVRGILLTVLTLGLYYPAFQVRIRQFLWGQSRFGNREFAFTGNSRDLIPMFVFALPLTVMTFGIFWPWWSALRHRYFWAHTAFGGARFRSTVTGSGLFTLWLSNAAIVTATLGLGLSWATVRSARFWSSHVELAGDPDLPTVRQDSDAAGPAGEGFADFLGLDFGF